MGSVRSLSMRVVLQFTRGTRLLGRLRLARALNPTLMPPGGRILSVLPIGIRMELDLNDPLQQWFHYLGDYEPLECDYIRSTLPRGGTFVDVGANVGWHTLPAARHIGREGRVYAFEPIPSNAASLRRNIELNGLPNVIVETRALSDRPGPRAMAMESPHSSNASMAPPGPDSPCFEVECVRFDDYVRSRGIGRIDLIKLDIEGAETAALRGMTGLLDRDDAPAILCELNPTMLDIMGSSCEELLTLMGGLGYRPHRLAPGPALRPLGSLPGQYEHVNAVFVKMPSESRHVPTAHRG